MSIFHESGRHSPKEKAARDRARAEKSREINEAFYAEDAPEPSYRSEQPAARKKPVRRSLAVTGVVLLMLVLLLLISYAAFRVWASAPSIENEGLQTHAVDTTDKNGDVIENVVTPEPATTPGVEMTPTPETTAQPASGRREGVYTILVVGQDIAGMNTDTIMVGCFDTVQHSLNVVSIPRDTLVNVPWSIKKVNTYYGQADSEEGLVDSISELIGYKVDSYVVVNVKAFEEVIDAIGGVYFDVPVNMSWGDPVRGRSYNIAKGYQLLNGRNALGVVRFRKNTDGSGYATGDIGRIQTQQQFAIAAIKQMLSLGNVPNLNKVISIVTDNLKTNLSSANLAFYAQEFLKLNSESISFETMPFDPVYIKGGSYVSIQLAAWLDMLNADLNPYYETITEEHLDILTYVNGGFYSTTGILAGGYGSFYDYTS